MNATSMDIPRKMSRHRLLLLTSACDSTDVGEAWSSYQWVSRLARLHDVTLLTCRKRNRPPVGPQLPGVRVVEWVDPPFVGRFDKFNSMAKPGYLWFHHRARRWICQELQAGRKFDLAHQVSPLALRYPSPAAGLGIPLVIGPVGGSLKTLPNFVSECGAAPWYTKLRNLDSWRLRHDPILKRTYESADVILGVAPYVRDLLASLSIKRFEVMSETGVVEFPLAYGKALRSDGTIRLLFVGRIIRTKGVRDAIRALAHLSDLLCDLDVIGEGDDLPACRAEAERLGVSSRVRFHGRIPRIQLDPFYASADIMLFPSFREPSGNSVLEAMSHGLPMVVADNGGPAEAVTDDCGIRVKPTTLEGYPRELAAAIRRIVCNPAGMVAMGRASRQRIADTFLWDKKVAWMSGLYQQVLEDYTSPRQSEPAKTTPIPLVNLESEYSNCDESSYPIPSDAN